MESARHTCREMESVIARREICKPEERKDKKTKEDREGREVGGKRGGHGEECRQCLLLLSDWSSRAGVGGEDTGETDSEEELPVAIFQSLVYPGLSPASGSFPKCCMGRKEGQELLSSFR